MASAEMMDLQPELEWYMLPFLVDFMIEVHSQFRMSPYTLHLAINLINRYVSKRVVFKKHYQLVGCAALWIAAKFEDGKDKVPTVRELRNMCVNAYEEDMFVQMEGHVLATLHWEIGGVQTCDRFVEHYPIICFYRLYRHMVLCAAQTFTSRRAGSSCRGYRRLARRCAAISENGAPWENWGAFFCWTKGARRH